MVRGFSFKNQTKIITMTKIWNTFEFEADPSTGYHYYKNPEDPKYLATGLEDLQLLSSIVAANKPRTIVETGTHFGLGTIAMAQSSESTTKIYSVEWDKQYLEVAYQNIASRGLQASVIL